jgi:tripeptide aminopeptidase
MKKVVDRFLKYIEVDTTSDESSNKSPSSSGQYELARNLKLELEEIGLTDVYLDDNGYLYGSIPGNIKKEVPVVGFLSHLDTSPDMSGKNIKPNIINNYNGKDILLNEKLGIALSPQEFPDLLNYKNQNIITTDGTTLLGADDKAGIAEIITAVEYIINNQIKHGEIKIAFTPDEEIGRGVDLIDFKRFNTDFAYTIDGEELGSLEYETFNAANATVVVKGKNIHPGYAKNKMINSILIAHEFLSLLPETERPENTEGYQGYYHLNSIKGNVEETVLSFLIRDHDKGKFEERKNLMKNNMNSLNKKYSMDILQIEINDVYYNMKDKILPYKHVIEYAKQAIKECNMDPKILPIRGGTDGAKLSYKGLPCPNLFAGGHNAHGKYEYIPVESMVKAVEVIIKIVEMITEE